MRIEAFLENKGIVDSLRRNGLGVTLTREPSRYLTMESYPDCLLITEREDYFNVTFRIEGCVVRDLKVRTQAQLNNLSEWMIRQKERYAKDNNS